MSLIEATIILMILFVLTAVLSPTISDYIADARQTKGKEDVEAIGGSIVRLLRDVGLPFPTLNPQEMTANLRLATNRVDLLIGDGPAPTSTGTAFGVAASPAGYVIATTLDWDDVDAATDQIANMNAHLVTNVITANGLEDEYPLVIFPAASGPRSGLGWRGSYINGPIGPDPWGNRYAATTVFLSPSSDSTGVNAGTNFDAFVFSAGPDGVAATDMEGTGITSGGTTPGGDDLVFVFSGNTR